MANYTWPSQTAGTVTLASVGSNGSTAPTSSMETGVVDGSGNLQPLTQGQAAMAASIPVVIASDQSAVFSKQSGTWNITNVSGTVSLPTGAATAAKQPALGTAGSASTDVITVQGIASMTALKVDASATTQPVSGTVTANQGGTWNITNVSGTVSLPTGAATAAKQPALGTAGSASSDVITVQGISSMTALKVDGSAVTQPVSGTVTAKSGTPTAGSVTQAAVTVGTTAVRATVSGSAPSASRSLLVINPDMASAAKFYIGTSTVTSSGATRGLQILGGQAVSFNNDAGDYYIISDTAAQTVYILEQA